MDKVYRISKEDCAKQISGVCPGCGGVVEPIETVDNSDHPTFWSGCKHCQQFCCGIDKAIWRTARNLVENGEYWHYNPRCNYEGTPERLEYWKDTETGHLAHLIKRILFEYEKVKGGK